MKRLVFFLVTFLAVCLLSACDMWNNPYPATDAGKSILYTAFTERPKHLDPAQAYSENEYEFLSNIYAPPLQYHYLKRPYQLVTMAASAMPGVRYLDALHQPLPDDAPAGKIAYSVYEIHIKPHMRFQPHPAFAKDTAGKSEYDPLKLDALHDIHGLGDFSHSGTREVRAADYVYQIKRLAHPQLHLPIFGVMSEYIVGLKDYAATLQQALKQHPDNFLDLNAYPLPGVQVVDDTTYRITIRGKYPQFAYWLAMPFFAPMPQEVEHFYAQPGMKERNLTLDWWPVGSGPYYLSENDPNRRMVLTRNPYYDSEVYPVAGEAGDEKAGLLVDAGRPLPLTEKVVFTLEKETIPYWNKFLQGYYDASGISSDSFDQAVQVSVGGEASVTDSMREQGITLSTSVATSTMYTGFNWLDPVVGGCANSNTVPPPQPSPAGGGGSQPVVQVSGKGATQPSPASGGGSQPVVQGSGKGATQPSPAGGGGSQPVVQGSGKGATQPSPAGGGGSQPVVQGSGKGATQPSPAGGGGSQPVVQVSGKGATQPSPAGGGGSQPVVQVSGKGATQPSPAGGGGSQPVVQVSGKGATQPSPASGGGSQQRSCALQSAQSIAESGGRCQRNDAPCDPERARKLRRAIAIAVDFEEFVSIFANGRGIAAQSPIPPGIFGYRDGEAGLNHYVYDWVGGAPVRKPIAEAQRLLAEAGYPGGVDAESKQPLVIHLDTTANGVGNKSRLDWLRKQFDKLGVQLDVRSTDYNRFQDKIRRGDTQMFYFGWNADYPDPENFLFLLEGAQGKVAKGGENAANYSNPEYDGLFEQMKNMENSPERQAIIDRMLEIIRRDSPWLWGYHPKNYILQHGWLHNVKPNVMATNKLKYWRVDALRRDALRREWNSPVLWPLWLATATLMLAGLWLWRVLRRREG